MQIRAVLVFFAERFLGTTANWIYENNKSDIN